LTENYVEDEDGLFRFDYSKEFLKWALTPPGYYQDWIFGIILWELRIFNLLKVLE